MESKALRKLAPHCHSLAAASTRTTAFLAARARPGIVVPPGKEHHFLAHLPIHLLFTYNSASSSLLSAFRRWGIRTLGQLSNLPEKDLQARIGAEGIRLYKMARGEDTDFLNPYAHKPVFEERKVLDWELNSLDHILFFLKVMLERLCQRLRNHGLAAESLVMNLTLSDKTSSIRKIRLASPLRDTKSLLLLVRLNLRENLILKPVVEISVKAEPAQIRFAQASMLKPEGARSTATFIQTLAQIEALVGKENVGRPFLLDTHCPDGIGMEPFPAHLENPGPESNQSSIRTEVLSLAPPECLLLLRRIRFSLPVLIQPKQIVSQAGPWRLTGGWWRESTGWGHDEWDLELVNGVVCRICWSHHMKRWYLQGIYD